MHQPLSFVHPSFSGHVCRLKKSLYGLKQAPRAWFHQFNSFLSSKGFICSKVDSSMFVYHYHSTILVLLLYMDDMLLIGNSFALIHSFIATLSTEFAIKDLGDLHYFLGVQWYAPPLVSFSHNINMCLTCLRNLTLILSSPCVPHVFLAPHFPLLMRVAY